MATKIIAITNQKGGVGKTTTTVNLAASFGATKRRVLLIDFDPQGNATSGSGINKEKIELSVADVLLNLAPIGDVIQKTKVGYDVLPANSKLTTAEIQLLKLDAREYFLQNHLKTISDNYDFIFIDCPPALNILTVNALVAANSVIIPMQCEYYALEGIAGLIKTIENLRQTVNPGLYIEGILRTMYDGRNRLTNDVSQQLKTHFPNKVYDTVIPRNVRLAEAPSHGLPVLLYDKNSQGAMAYLTLTGEICKKRD